MKKLFNIAVGIVVALVASVTMSVAGDRDLVGQILGQGLGAYGGAKLCGGGTANQVACGTVGGILGGVLLKSNHKKTYPARRSYQTQMPRQPYQVQRPVYQQQQQYVPQMPVYTQSCQQVAVAMPNGTYGTGLMCRMINGYWQMVSVNPVK